MPKEFLSGNILRIYIPNPRRFNLRIPTGNEAGANGQWLPAGKLPTGRSEAIINFDKKYTPELITQEVK